MNPLTSLLRFSRPRALRCRGVLGINARNADFVLPLNPRRLYPRVDDKLATKAICQANGIRVPETFMVIERFGDVKRFVERLGGRTQFVIKPARGSGGRGVMVISEHDGRTFQTPGGARFDIDDVRHHLATTLSGLYSLGAHPDRAIVEQRIVMHPAFETVARGGTPDVRVIVHRGEPAMAMVRLPTQASRGRANLHQGAAAAGIDLATGVTSGGVWRSRAIDTHPDTGAAIAGLSIPAWPDVLTQSARLAAALELGYLGIDFVIDAALGPVVLEANARPGLAIQTANRRGLLGVLGKGVG